MADEKITKIAEVYQIYLMDFLQFYSYLIEKGECDEVEEKYQENLRRMKKGR